MSSGKNAKVGDTVEVVIKGKVVSSYSEMGNLKVRDEQGFTHIIYPQEHLDFKITPSFKPVKGQVYRVGTAGTWLVAYSIGKGLFLTSGAGIERKPEDFWETHGHNAKLVLDAPAGYGRSYS